MAKKITIDGIKYTITRRHKVNLGYGTAGSKGITVWKEGDTSQTNERYSNMAEFRKELRARKKLRNKRKN